MKVNLRNEGYADLSLDASLHIVGDLGGSTLLPGVYKATGSVTIQNGDLILDAQGNEHAEWIFEIASDLVTVGGRGGNVILCGGAKAQNVFWTTDRMATIGAGTSFKGSILSKMMNDEKERLSGTRTTILDRLPLKEWNNLVIFKRRPRMGSALYGQGL